MGPTPGRRQSNRERRDQRTERILDVTSDLVLRWGYRKTTLDDIAREVGVAKGTLFLHWRNRDTLFVSLLRRERLRLYDGLIDRLDDSPPVSMETFFTQLASEILNRPLIRAVLVGDEDVLGRLVHQKRPSPTTAGTRREFAGYLDQLRDLGLIRTDLDTAGLQTICTATFMGFVFSALRMSPLTARMPDLPDEERYAELCGDALGRLLRPADRGVAASDDGSEGNTEGIVPDTAERAFTRVTLGFLERSRTVARDGYRASLQDVGGSS